MQYTEKLGTITRVGPQRKEFPNGSPVTIKFKQNGIDKSLPGVSVGVQFDFDKDVWYSGIVFEKQAGLLQEGKQIKVKVWDKESNGKIYKNFGLVTEKKDIGKLEEKVNELTTQVHRMSQQITAMYQDIVKLKDYQLKKETTTAFDTGFKDVYPDQHAEIYGSSEEYNKVTNSSVSVDDNMPNFDDFPVIDDSGIDEIDF